MITRATKVQLVLFLIITLGGLYYVGVNYVGLFKGFLSGGQCTVYANFADSGGIFTNAEVTYRGVAIGRVGQLKLLDNGVQAAMDIDNCNTAKVPVTSAAAVADRSVIGEQYIDLTPSSGAGPYFKGGEVIPMTRTSIPIAAETLLTNLDSLVTSVDLDKLRITVTELGNAFDNRGPDLGSLLDSNHDLLTAAQQNLPETIALIEQSSTVLQTQLDLQDPLKSWTHSLNLLSAQLKASDPDIRRLLTQTPAALDVVQNLVKDNQTDLGATLANLATIGKVLVRHLDGIEEVLELYPALAAGGMSVVQPDGVAQLGLVTATNPRDCGDPTKGSEGYQGTKLRSPSDTSPAAPNVSARCTASASSGVNVRGSQNVPGGDPVSVPQSTVAYPRAGTGNTQKSGAGSAGTSVGTQSQTTYSTRLNSAGILGDKAWVAIMTSALH